MKNKATHTGHCQVCGAQQKLPGGMLSIHGYTVEFSFFEGICAGTKHLPFEQDISLIKDAIARALQITATIKADIARFTNSTETSAWFHVYEPTTNHRGYKISKYFWRYLPVCFETTHYPAEGNGTGNEFWSHKYGHSVEQAKSMCSRQDAGITYSAEFPMANTVETRNSQYRHMVLEVELTRVTNYIKWQRHRILNWKPTETTPIEVKS